VNAPISNLKGLYSEEAEQAVLGGVMLDAEAYALVLDEGLRAEHFFAQAHRDIWQAMQAQADVGQPLDVVTLSEQLERTGRLESMGGLEYLMELVRGTPSAANVAAYAGIILRRAHERHWVATLHSALDGFYDPTVADAVAKAESLLVTLEGRPTGAGFMPLREALKHFVDLKDDQFNNPGLRGLQTGYHNIDHRLNGLQPGNLMVVGARPGMGKTNYLLNIMRQVALQKHDYQILMFTLEMNNSELVQRLVGAQGEIKGDLLKSAKVFDHQPSLSRMTTAVHDLVDLRVQLCDAASLTVAEIAAMTRTVHRRAGVGLVLVDYLGLVDADGRIDTQALRIAEITRALKKLAKEIACPVIIAAQLSRKVEERRDKRPVLSDLRDSGAIEQDADVVQFLYRDEYYYPDSTNHPGQVEVITAKLRDGETGTDYLGWQGQYYKMNSQSTFDREDGGGPPGRGEDFGYGG
jgi:replicative DNA helicase